MSGYDQNVTNRALNDPAAVASIIASLLPTIYYNERPIAKPGQFVGALAQGYDQSRLERGLEELKKSAAQTVESAATPPWASLKSTATGPEDFSGLDTIPNLQQQAAYRAQRPRWSQFVANASPEQMRTLIRTGGLGPQAGGIEREFQDMVKMDFERAEADRKADLLNVALSRLVQNRHDPEAEAAIAVLAADPSIAEGKLSAFKDLRTRRAQMAALSGMYQQASTEQLTTWIESDLFRDQYAKAERSKQNKPVIERLAAFRQWPKEFTDSLLTMNEMGGLDNQALQFLAQAFDNSEVARFVREHPQIVSSWGHNVPVEQATLQKLIETYPALAQMVMDTNQKADTAYKQELDRVYGRGMAAANLGYVNEKFKLEAQSSGDASLRGMMQIAVSLMQVENSKLATAKSMYFQLKTLPPEQLKKDSELQKQLLLAEVRMKEAEDGVHNATQQYYYLVNPAAAYMGDKDHYNRKLKEVAESTQEPSRRIRGLDLTELGLDNSYKTYMSKMIGGEQYYRDMKAKIDTIRKQILTPKAVEKPIEKKERSFPWNVVDPYLPGPKLGPPSPTKEQLEENRVLMAPPYVELPQAGTLEQAIPLR